MTFDLLAPCYRSLELIAFGNALQQCRVACLGEIANPRRALIVGEGNGRFLIELLQLHPQVEVDCVEASRRMLQLARERIVSFTSASAGRVNFLHQDILSWVVPAHRYDLLVTNFFLDCFLAPTLLGLTSKLAGAATDDATWLLSDFRVPPDGIGRLRARSWLTAMYPFFRVTARIEANELIDPTPFMWHEGFVLERRKLSRKGMLKAELWRRTGNSAG